MTVAEALGAGASLITTVSGGRHDLCMFGVAAASGVPLVVLMHMQGTTATMQQDPRYEEVVEEVRPSCWNARGPRRPPVLRLEL